MALATAADVEVALGRALLSTESERVDYLLRRASALVVSHLGGDPTDLETEVVPEDVVDTVAAMVSRVFERAATSSVPAGAIQASEGMGPFSRGFTFSAGANSSQPWLEKGDKIALKPFRVGGGMTSVEITSGRTGRYRREA